MGSIRSEKKNVKSKIKNGLFSSKGLEEKIVCQDVRAEAEVCVHACYVSDLILITGKSLIRQCRALVMLVKIKDSEVSHHLYKDPK